MGGHGGLNILPQKKWNVYNYDNRDIVEKDKKEHAQKTRKNYQTQRKHTIQMKFDVLKGQDSIIQRNKQHLKQSYKKDSILNNEFKRLTQENQHVNLFEHQQKIIQNREVLQYQKMKQAQWLKDKNMDYSSKFLGTYNDDSKIPWYAKTKGIIGNDIELKKQNKVRIQRYDMQDLTDKVRLQKLESKKQQYFGHKETFITNQFSRNVVKQQGQRKVKKEFNDERQRSRNKKYEFIKQRQDIKYNNSKDWQQFKGKQENIYLKTNLQYRTNNIHSQHTEQIKQSLNKLTQSQTKSKNIPKQNINNDELQLLRIKRLKRQEKQRKKAEQLRKKLQQSINRT